MKKSIFLLLMALALTACKSTYRVFYDISLNSVESPADAKIQYGENKIVKFTEGNNQKYSYKDKYLDIMWIVYSSKLEFIITNISGHTMKINWDDVSYVNYNGYVSRVMHKGVKYIEREKPQGSISIPNKATYEDIILPTDNVHFNPGYGAYVPAKWESFALIPCYYNNKKEMLADLNNGTWIGKTIRILLPIEIAGVKNDYSFEFRVNEVISLDK